MINYPVRLAQLQPDKSTRVRRAVLSYDQRDPYAVSMNIEEEPDPVAWLFGRDLLAEGLVRRCGEGDVVVAPDRDRIMFALISDEGHAILFAGLSQVQAFLALTFAVMPRGHELDGIDVGAEVERVLEDQ